MLQNSRVLEISERNMDARMTNRLESRMARNPLQKQLQDWLPEIDFGVMSHGFAPHGRDYLWVVEAPSGTYEITLTHVVELRYETRVLNRAEAGSWDDLLTDYATAYLPGAPEGYVWGSNWSLAYPGLAAPDNDTAAAQWSERTGRPMYAMSSETDRFKVSIIFRGSRSRKFSDDASTLKKVLIPLPSGYSLPET